MVAALYVDPQGAYADVPGVDLWPEERDARQYAGPWPVVAHPPCARWCALAGLVEYRYGLRRGDDGGTFAAALASVRQYGGVLEHPAFSHAWDAYDLPVPLGPYWTRSLLDDGWTCDVYQSAYGHPAAKRTWLYYVGEREPAPLLTEPGEILATVSWAAYRWRPERPRLRSRDASRTPPAFRDALLALARAA